MARNDTAKNRNGGNLGFEAELFKAADKLRGNMEPSDYSSPAPLSGQPFCFVGGGRTPVQLRLCRLKSSAAGVSGNGRGSDQAFCFNRSTSAWKAGVSSEIRVSMSRT
jgi:hypothetical protein